MSICCLYVQFENVPFFLLVHLGPCVAGLGKCGQTRVIFYIKDPRISLNFLEKTLN